MGKDEKGREWIHKDLLYVGMRTTSKTQLRDAFLDLTAAEIVADVIPADDPQGFINENTEGLHLYKLTSGQRRFAIGDVITLECDPDNTGIVRFHTANVTDHVDDDVKLALVSLSTAERTAYDVIKSAKKRAKADPLADALEPVRQQYHKIHNHRARAAFIANVIAIVTRWK